MVSMEELVETGVKRPVRRTGQQVNQMSPDHVYC